MQQLMLNPEDITDPTTAMNMALVLMAKAFKLNYSILTNNNQRILSNPRNRQIAQPGMNMGQDRQIQMVEGNSGNQFRQYTRQNIENHNGYNAGHNAIPHMGMVCLVAARLSVNAIGNNVINKMFNYKRLGHLARNCTFDLMDAAADLDEIEEVNADCILMVICSKHDIGYVNDKALSMLQDEQLRYTIMTISIIMIYSICSLPEKQYTRGYRGPSDPFPSQKNDSTVGSEDEIFPIVNQFDARLQNFKIQFLKEAAKFVRDFKSLAKEADESLVQHKALELKIERLLREVVSQDIMSIVQKIENKNSVTRAQTKTIIDSLQNKLHDTIYENAKLRAQLFDKVSEQVDTTKGTSTNTKFANQSTERKPSLQPVRKNLVVRQPNAFQSEHTTSSKNRVPQKVDETNDLSKLVTSNSVSTPQESKVMKNDNVIALGMFRINPFKPFWEEKSMPNKVRASVRTKPITISQPYVITKKDVNSDSNGLSSTGVYNTAKTRRPQLRINTKNDMVPSTSKSSCSKNKEVEVEEHPRNLLLSKNKKYMSSECNNVKLAIQNDKSKVVCAMYKQCLITANHDVCVLNYVNDMNSHGKKQKANVSNTENQKKQKPKVMKPKKIGSNKRLASLKPSKPRYCLRWSPTRRIFDLKGKIIANSEFECQSNCSNGDNACTSNPQEPIIKQNLKLLINFVWKFLGTVRFGTDHVAAILGFDDL
ncbi:hypothetical protein Tco_1050621 [Tanacetum coccineum]